VVDRGSIGFRSRRKGQGLAEMAIILPLLVFIFLAMIEVGLWAQSWLTVANAAREGARFASRGFHVSASDIAEISTVVMSGSMDVELFGADANTRIIVTQVDIEADGSYVIHSVYTLGDFPAGSAVCLNSPCADGQIDLYGARMANAAFNTEAQLCREAAGCRADIIVVEAFYSYSIMTPVPIITDYISGKILLNGRSAMRMLYRRDTP
jgi:hypothetical protein